MQSYILYCMQMNTIRPLVNMKAEGYFIVFTVIIRYDRKSEYIDRVINDFTDFKIKFSHWEPSVYKHGRNL